MPDDVERMLDEWGKGHEGRAGDPPPAFLEAVGRTRRRRVLAASGTVVGLMAVASAVALLAVRSPDLRDGSIAGGAPIDVRLDVCRPTVLALSRANFIDGWEEPQPCGPWSLAWARETPALP